MKRIAITLDIDWAPDFVIDATAALLAERNVKSTWFVTHASPAVDRLRARPDIVELGIHPNFMPGSSHGASPSEILSTCMSCVPDAISMRTHGLWQSSSLWDRVMRDTPIRNDLSTFMPLVTWAEPYPYRRFGRCLTRIPYFWEDDYAMDDQIPEASASGFSGLLDLADAARALAIFNFHPIHVYLNSGSMAGYESVKAACPLGLRSATPDAVKPHINRRSDGARTALIAIADHLARSGGGSFAREIEVH